MERNKYKRGIPLLAQTGNDNSTSDINCYFQEMHFEHYATFKQLVLTRTPSVPIYVMHFDWPRGSRNKERFLKFMCSYRSSHLRLKWDA